MTNHRTVHHRRMAALVSAAACLTMLASCGDDDDPSEAQGTTMSSTAAPESTEPPTTLTPEQEVEAAFHEWTAVMDELTTVEPNPDDGRLAELVLEPQLSEIRANVGNLAATNQIYEPGIESSYEILDTVVEATGTTARVTVCIVGADALIDRDTGDVIRQGVSTLEDEATYQLQNGHWMMAEYTNVNSWQGVTRCA